MPLCKYSLCSRTDTFWPALKPLHKVEQKILLSRASGKIWTHNLLITDQLHCRCTTEALTYRRRRIRFCSCLCFEDTCLTRLTLLSPISVNGSIRNRTCIRSFRQLVISNRSSSRASIVTLPLCLYSQMPVSSRPSIRGNIGIRTQSRLSLFDVCTPLWPIKLCSQMPVYIVLHVRIRSAVWVHFKPENFPTCRSLLIGHSAYILTRPPISLSVRRGNRRFLLGL